MGSSVTKLGETDFDRRVELLEGQHPDQVGCWSSCLDYVVDLQASSTELGGATDVSAGAASLQIPWNTHGILAKLGTRPLPRSWRC